AQDRSKNCEVVIKVPRQAMLDDPDFSGRFLREVRSLLRLQHPHIVKVLDVGEHDEVPFLVLDYLTGGSLRQRLRGGPGVKRSPQQPAELRTWLPGVAAALDFMHQQQYIHRDVKPDNILFDEHGIVYLSDFGIAKAVHSAPKIRQTVMTRVGMILGTP